MMYRLLFIFCLFLTGCNGCDVRNKLGLGQSSSSDDVAVAEKEEKQRLEEDRKRLEAAAYEKLKMEKQYVD